MMHNSQITDVRVFTVTRPRTFIRWTDNAPGADKSNCWERIDDSFIRYVNMYNTSMSVTINDKYFEFLEKMYIGAQNKNDEK